MGAPCRILAALLCAAATISCGGGELGFERPDGSGADGAGADGAGGPPAAVVVTAPKAPADYLTTSEQAKDWEQKFKGGKDFNNVLIQNGVVEVAPALAAEARLEPGRVCFPKAGNEHLLQL